MTRRGRCDRCKLSYEWKGGPILRSARCPYCKDALAVKVKGTKWPLSLSRPEEVNGEGQPRNDRAHG